MSKLRYGLSFEEYLALPGEHYSKLKEIRRSPLHYRSSPPLVDSDALRAGRALHAYALDPGSVNVVQFDGRRFGKSWEDFKARHEGAVILKPDDLGTVERMRDSLVAHPFAAELLAGGSSEVTAQFEIEGVPFKARLDRLADDGTLVELKTTRDVHPIAFEREYARQLYHAQAALYWIGLRECGIDCSQVRCIAVDKKPPFEVVVYRIGQDVLEAGTRLVYGWVAQLKECRERNAWPGVDAGGVVDLRIPEWALTEGLPDVEMEDENGEG